MSAPSPLDAVIASATSLGEELVAFRRDLHAHPELARRESRTTSAVAARLTAAGVRVRPLPGTGLVADLGPENPAYRVALRADLDALPVGDRTGLPWASRTEGLCHACGHDVHIAAVTGAGLALHAQRELLTRLDVGVRLVFQPAEEVIPGGAHDLLALGVLDGVDRILGVHCDPTVDVGHVGLVAGPITAAADSVVVTLTGGGGHTSRPHLTQDLTFALAKVVTEVPAVLSRRVDPRAGAALVWGSLHAGSAQNVIPASGTASGTLRMLDAKAWEDMGSLVEDAVASVVAPYGVSAKVEHERGVPPVVNDPHAVAALREAAVAALGLASVLPTRQSLGGEDFAWYLTKVPGAMARLGTRAAGGRTYELHQGDLVVEEGAVVAGAALLAGAAIASAPTGAGKATHAAT